MSGGSDTAPQLVLLSEMPRVQEVAPGLWGPAFVHLRGFPVRNEESDFERNITFSAIDVTTPIPDSEFVLQRPPGYYVNDYIANLHFRPEALGEPVESPELEPTVEAAALPEKLSAHPLQKPTDIGSMSARPALSFETKGTDTEAGSWMWMLAGGILCAGFLAGLAIVARRSARR